MHACLLMHLTHQNIIFQYCTKHGGKRVLCKTEGCKNIAALKGLCHRHGKGMIAAQMKMTTAENMYQSRAKGENVQIKNGCLLLNDESTTDKQQKRGQKKTDKTATMKKHVRKDEETIPPLKSNEDDKTVPQQLLPPLGESTDAGGGAVTINEDDDSIGKPSSITTFDI